MSLVPCTGSLKPDCELADWWKIHFGNLDVPLWSPLPEKANTPEGVKECYRVDLRRCTTHQIIALAQRAALRFSIPYIEIEIEMRATRFMPILVEHFSTVAFDGRFVL